MIWWSWEIGKDCSVCNIVSDLYATTLKIEHDWHGFMNFILMLEFII